MEPFIQKKITALYKKHGKNTSAQVEEKVARPIISLWLIHTDIDTIIECINKINDFSKIKSVKVDDLIISALWQKAILAYGKIFLNSDHGFSKLELKNYALTKTELKIHAKLMDIRHNYIAHRGNNDFENCILIAVLNKYEDKYKFHFEFPTIQRVGNYINDSEIVKVLRYLEKLKAKVHQNIETKLIKLDKRIWDLLKPHE